MLKSLLPSLSPEEDEAGFSLLELMVAMLLAAIVLAGGGQAIVSLSRAADRNDSVVKEEQSASQVMAQLERDIRSASTITFPNGVLSSQQLELNVVGSSGTTTAVLWVYNPSAETLTREVQSQGAFSTSGMQITNVTNVTNGAGTPVFTYYDFSSTDISSTSNSNIAQCATGVAINVKVSSSTSGVGNYQESAEVALTNRLEDLSAPGNGQCGSA